MRLAPILAILMSAGVAAAQDNALARGIDPVGNKLSTSFDSYLTLEGARFAPAGSFRLSLALDSSNGLMSFKTGDQKGGDLIKNRLDLHLMGAYAITKRIEVGLDVPFTAWQRNGFADLESATGFSDPPTPKSAGLGDLRALGKFRILDQDQAFVNVAVIAELRAPTGDDVSFLGERGVLLLPRAVVERDLTSDLRLGFEAGYRYRTSPGRYLNLYVGDEIALALAGSYNLPKVAFLDKWAAYAEVLASTQARAPFTFSAADAMKTPLELLLGVRANVGHDLWLLLGGGTGLSGSSGFGRESWRLFASVTYQRFRSDRDGDGIPDDVDKCPDVPEDVDGFQDEDGCPDPDNDADGIPDKEDRCPDRAGPKEYDGCPDTDEDEVPDPDDKCPTVIGPAENNGCPFEGPQVIFEREKLTIKSSINFEFGKASIKKNSYPVLDEVAKVMTEHKEIKHVRVDGHTDSVGGAHLNLELSQRRAKSVVDYLIGKGVDAERLSAQGFGLTKPVAPNSTALGRAKNRRVEFSVVP